MFERFTEKARQTCVYAQDEARALNHNYVGTEHLLIGLLRLGGYKPLPTWVLRELGLSAEVVRGQVARIVGLGDEFPIGPLPYTPRAKKVLELALREALSLGHNYIGPEHILLGIVRENGGVASRILTEFGGEPYVVRAMVHDMMVRRGQTREKLTEAFEKGASEASDSVKQAADDLRAAVVSWNEIHRKWVADRPLCLLRLGPLTITWRRKSPGRNG